MDETTAPTDRERSARFLAIAYGEGLSETSLDEYAEWFCNHLAENGGQVNEDLAQEKLQDLRDCESGLDLELIRQVRASSSAVSYSYEDFHATLNEDVATHARRVVTIAARPRSNSRTPRSRRRVTRSATRAGSSSSDDLPPLPLGALHSAHACARCGAGDDLYITVLRSTLAEGALCCDLIGCERRRAERRRIA
jgi:hypothetical protein